MLSFDNLSAGYGPCNVLQAVSGRAQSGELIALIGPNGSGKSTLLKTLCGIVPARGGTVTLGQTPLTKIALKTRARQIAYLGQSREAMPAMSARQVITLGRAPYRGALGKISTTGELVIKSAIARTQSESFMARRFDSLSGGEQARVLLARALAVGAPVLLADEPIAALDPFYQITMMEILKAEAKAGQLVICALHDLSLAAGFADRIWVMNEGRIVQNGTPAKTLSAKTLKTVFGIKAPKDGFSGVSLA